MSITKSDARKIAKALGNAAQAIDDYLDENFRTLAREEYEFLNESFKTIQRTSSFVTTVAVGLAIKDLQDPVTEMQGVIDQAKEKIQNLKNVGRVIRFVASLVDLAAGIMAKDPNAIAGSVNNIVKLINESNTSAP